MKGNLLRVKLYILKKKIDWIFDVPLIMYSFFYIYNQVSIVIYMYSKALFPASGFNFDDLHLKWNKSLIIMQQLIYVRPYFDNFIVFQYSF